MKPGKSRGSSPRKPERTGFAQRHPHFPAGLGLFFLTLLAYANSFDGGFVLDNKGLILNDPRLREATAANLRLILQHTYWWPTGEGGVYRPLTTLTYLFNYAILGNRDQPGGYHAINFVLHAFNALLVYALALRFVRRLWPSFFIAAVWTVHPVLTEAVTNMVGRADVLAATGLLAGFLLYLKSTETSGGKHWAYLAGVAAATAIGVFSKENAVVLPGIIIVYEVVFRREWSAKPLEGLATSLIPIAAMFWQRAAVLAASLPKEVPFTDNPILGARFLDGRLTAFKVLARYLWLTLWPARLSADYSWSEIPIAHGSAADWLWPILIVALIPTLVFLYRVNRRAFFLVCVGAAWMAPVSNVLFPIGSIMAERFLYVPVLSFAACAVLAVYRVWPKYAPIANCVLIAALTVRTWVRNADWKDDLSIATASVEASPGSFKTHDLLANVLYASDPTHGNIDRVIQESEKSLAILDPLPDDRNQPDPYRLAGECYLYRGEYSKSIAALIRFLEVEKAEFGEFKRTLKPGVAVPEYAESITNDRQGDADTLLSIAYLRSGDTDKARAAADQARALNPLSSQLYRQRSAIAAADGRIDEAATTLVEGAFVMSDPSLRETLVELYKRSAVQGSCALTAGPRGPALNPACPMVHGHLCAAEAGTIETLIKTGQNDAARTRERMFTEEFGCPAR
jgi:hypothetical protein